MRRAISVLGLAMVFLAAAACQQQAPTAPASSGGAGAAPAKATAAPAAPVASQKVVVGLNADVQNFNPITTMDATTDRVISNIYDYLFTRDKDMKVVGQLAESGRPLDDLNWEIKLRKGVKFSDGEPFNADTVKAVLEYIANKANNSPRLVRIQFVKSVTVLDDSTVKVTTSKPFPTLLEGLTQVYMVPAKSLSADGIKALASTPIGTGPYKLQAWNKEQSITLVANDNYWGVKPQIGSVEFRIIPDVNARVSALLAGEVDLVPDVPPQSMDQVNNSGTTQVRPVFGNRIIYVGFNTLQPGIFRDVRARQAINYAVDVDKIIRTVLGGNGKRMAGPLPPINQSLDPNLKPYPVDVAKAKELMQEAGYKGQELTLHTPSGRYLKDQEAAEAIADQLNQAGIKTKVQIEEWGNMLDMVKSNKITDMYLWGRQDIFLEGSIMNDLLHSGSTWVTNSDPKIDAAIDQALPIVDPEKRKAAFYQAQAVVQREAPWLFLWAQPDIYGVSKKLQWDPRGDGLLTLNQASLK